MKGGRVMKQQMNMNKGQNISIEEAYQLFIHKALIRNFFKKTMQTYNNHFNFFPNLLIINFLFAQLQVIQ